MQQQEQRVALTLWQCSQSGKKCVVLRLPSRVKLPLASLTIEAIVSPPADDSDAPIGLQMLLAVSRLAPDWTTLIDQQAYYQCVILDDMDDALAEILEDADLKIHKSSTDTRPQAARLTVVGDYEVRGVFYCKRR